MGNALGCIQLEPSSLGIKQTFGISDGCVLNRGCHFMPWCISSQLGGYISLRVQQLDVRCETKTKDNVFVTVVASIQYRVVADKAAVDAYYELSNPKKQIQAYVFDVIRASVPGIELETLFEQKNDIAKSVDDQLQKAMSMYGYEIIETLIVGIEPDECVKKAMNEISAASRMRVAAKEKAEAEKDFGMGTAWRHGAIIDGLKESVLDFTTNVPGTTTKDVMDMILVTLYFDSMKKIAASSKSTAMFIPHGPGAVKDVAAQIRDGVIQANTTTM